MGEAVLIREEREVESDSHYIFRGGGLEEQRTKLNELIDDKYSKYAHTYLKQLRLKPTEDVENIKRIVGDDFLERFSKYITDYYDLKFEDPNNPSVKKIEEIEKAFLDKAIADHCKFLGLPLDATEEQIKQGFLDMKTKQLWESINLTPEDDEKKICNVFASGALSRDPHDPARSLFDKLESILGYVVAGSLDVSNINKIRDVMTEAAQVETKKLLDSYSRDYHPNIKRAIAARKAGRVRDSFGLPPDPNGALNMPEIAEKIGALVASQASQTASTKGHSLLSALQAPRSSMPPSGKGHETSKKPHGRTM